jgi:hypothetical protein
VQSSTPLGPDQVNVLLLSVAAWLLAGTKKEITLSITCDIPRTSKKASLFQPWTDWHKLAKHGKVLFPAGLEDVSHFVPAI